MKTVHKDRKVKPVQWVHKGQQVQTVMTELLVHKDRKVKPVQWVHKGLPVRTALFPDRRDRKVKLGP